MAAAPQVLVLSEQAAEYAAELRAAGIDCLAAVSVAELDERHRPCKVVFGEPQLVSGALAQLPRLAWIQSTWAGLTPLLAAAQRGIAVTGVKEVFGAQMAEYVLGYLLALELRVFERRQWQQARSWRPELSGRLAGKTLGVMGTGSIGAAVARQAAGLGLRVLGYSRSGVAREPFAEVYDRRRLADFLAGLDYLVAVLPHTPETDGLLDHAAFQALPPGAVLVNVGRGSVLDEHALLAALHGGVLRAAVLDVFRQEPLPAQHPFWTAEGVYLTAHISAHSYPADIARIFIMNHGRFRAGEPLRYRLDPARGY